MKKVSTWAIVLLVTAVLVLGYQNVKLKEQVFEEHAKLEITHKAWVDTAKEFDDFVINELKNPILSLD